MSHALIHTGLFFWTLSQIIAVNNGVDILANTNVFKIELPNWGNFDGHYHYIISFPVPLRNISIVQSLKPSSILCNYLLSLNSCPSGGEKITKALWEFGSVQENECSGWLEPLLSTWRRLPPLSYIISSLKGEMKQSWLFSKYLWHL